MHTLAAKRHLLMPVHLYTYISSNPKRLWLLNRVSNVRSKCIQPNKQAHILLFIAIFSRSCSFSISFSLFFSLLLLCIWCLLLLLLKKTFLIINSKYCFACINGDVCVRMCHLWKTMTRRMHFDLSFIKKLLFFFHWNEWIRKKERSDLKHESGGKMWKINDSEYARCLYL